MKKKPSEIFEGHDSPLRKAFEDATDISEPFKGENWRKGYQTGFDEAMKACGGCKSCYGKGYGTQLETVTAKGLTYELPRINFCRCLRGKALEEEIKLMTKLVSNKK